MTGRILAAAWIRFSDGAGRRTKLAFKSEDRTGYLNLDTYTSYTYDSSKHWLSGVQRGGSASEKADFAYDNTDGAVTKVSYGNGARAEYGYDASGALTRISHFTNGGTLMARIDYAYDPAGNVTTATLSDALTYGGDAVVTYAYDDLYRLTREYCTLGGSSYRKEYGYEYWYDAVGNRTKMRFYNEASSQWETTEYAYSPRNELTSLVASGEVGARFFMSLVSHTERTKTRRPPKGGTPNGVLRGGHSSLREMPSIGVCCQKMSSHSRMVLT